ncbi:hypothetical protein MRB53_041465 [Persea americana]|nr:hypothetical protein MRB53_041465 [Persea americana]
MSKDCRPCWLNLTYSTSRSAAQVCYVPESLATYNKRAQRVTFLSVIPLPFNMLLKGPFFLLFAASALARTPKKPKTIKTPCTSLTSANWNSSLITSSTLGHTGSLSASILSSLSSAATAPNSTWISTLTPASNATSAPTSTGNATSVTRTGTAPSVPTTSAGGCPPIISSTITFTTTSRYILPADCMTYLARPSAVPGHFLTHACSHGDSHRQANLLHELYLEYLDHLSHCYICRVDLCRHKAIYDSHPSISRHRGPPSTVGRLSFTPLSCNAAYRLPKTTSTVTETLNLGSTTVIYSPVTLDATSTFTVTTYSYASTTIPFSTYTYTDPMASIITDTRTVPTGTIYAACASNNRELP